MDLDGLYREHAPVIVASLARSFGAARLDIVEAAVQEAFVAAIEQWGPTPPERPAAWLHTTAKRRAIDALRRAAWFAPEADDVEAPEPARNSDDDLLKMMLVCCHPSLPLEGAMALALRTLCGFPVPALARAFLADEAAIEKRLARARQTLRDEAVDFEPGPDASERVGAVLRTLYVLFFEGYSTHAGPSQIDEDLCRTAIRLSELVLSGFPQPAAYALHALMLLQASRLATRVDPINRGDLVPLHAQDRTRWDRAMIERGLQHLAAASRGDTISTYHLEAAIAACHAMASTYEATDWAQIVALYDKLHELAPSPVVALQRAIAIGRVDARRGLKALGAIADTRLDESPVLAAASGDLKERTGDTRGARAAYRRALELAGTEPERRFLEKKLAELG